MTVWFSQKFSSTAMNFVCLPQAGADTAVFARWENLIGLNCKIIRTILPGRGGRFNDPIPETLEELADDLFHVMKNIDLGPYAIIGSSMGGCLGYELCCRIEASDLRQPRALLVVVSNPPGFSTKVPNLENMSLDEAGRALVAFNPALSSVIADCDLLRCLLPMFIADFGMCRRYNPDHVVKIQTPLIAFAGEEDTIATPASVSNWRRCTSSWFDFTCSPGDHSLIADPPRALLSILERIARGAYPTIDASAYRRGSICN